VCQLTDKKSMGLQSYGSIFKIFTTEKISMNAIVQRNDQAGFEGQLEKGLSSN
jgi:hypothetical protein